MKFLGTTYERDITQALLSYMPNYYKNSKIVSELMRVDSIELEKIHQQATEILNQRFIDTADISLPSWEKEFGIQPAKATPVLTTETFSGGYSGKIPGSLVENPHVAMAAGNGGTTLREPNQFTYEFTEGNYSDIISLDEAHYKSSAASELNLTQHLFSINVVEEIEHKLDWFIPGQTIQEKVNWCRENINRLSFDWYGIGTYPGGYKANLLCRKNTGGWITTLAKTHELETTSKLSIEVNSESGNFLTSECIDNDGLVYFLAYSEPSSSTVASTIETNYVSFEYNVKWQRTEPYNRTKNELRALIKLQLRALDTITKELLKGMIVIYGGGDVEIIEDYNNYTITIRFLDVYGTPLRIEDLTIALRNLLPAHLDFNYQFRYQTWNDIDNRNFNWNTIDSKEFLWDNIDNGGYY
jgi:uncharacterized protein YmfQ (DUF2313 family)